MDNIILFDGLCNLCNGSVQFIVKRDKKAWFKFAPLQSDLAASLLSGVMIDSESIVLIQQGGIFQKSTAALKIARQLNSGWSLFYVFIFIPKFIRDFFYDIIARNRYKWFGKKDVCMIPTPELKSRFLETS